MPTVTTVKRRRGPFGWVIAIMFWCWHLLMVAWLVAASQAMQPALQAGSQAARSGATIGAGIGIIVILFIWMLGTVVLGGMMMFTRGKTVMTTKEVAG